MPKILPVETQPLDDPIPAEDRLAWEPQPGETSEAYNAFTFYRDFKGGRRSVAKAYQTYLREKHGLKHIAETDMQACGRWNRFAAAHQWLERAKAYDLHLDRTRRAATEAVITHSGIQWADERQRDMKARLAMLNSLRDGFTRMAKDGILLDSRRRISRRTGDNEWVISEEKVRLYDQLRVVLQLQNTLFPPDDREIKDSYGNSYDKFDPEVQPDPEPSSALIVPKTDSEG